MKQKNIVLLFVLMISAYSTIKADALENAIKESKLNEFIEFFNNSVVARVLKQQDAKRYLELAHEVLGERSSYLLRHFDSYDISRMSAGLLLAILGAGGGDVAVNSCKDIQNNKVEVSAVHYIALGCLGAATFGLGIFQWCKGICKSDRYEKYRNALAIHAILQSTQPLCQLEIE